MKTLCVGMQFRFSTIQDQGFEFPWDALRGAPPVRLEREDDNPYDQYAIKVILPAGWLDGGGPDLHIGYVPKHSCQRVRDAVRPSDWPLNGLITSVGTESEPKKRTLGLFIDTEPDTQ